VGPRASLDGSGEEKNFLPFRGFEPRIIQSVFIRRDQVELETYSVEPFPPPHNATDTSGPPYYRGFTIVLKTHYTRYDSSRRVISPSQRPLPDNTQHSQQTDIHALDGIPTCNPSKRAAADPRHRPRDHWDLLVSPLHSADLCPGTCLPLQCFSSFTLFLTY